MTANGFDGEHPVPLVENDRLQRHCTGSVAVYCSPGSEWLAKDIGDYADRCNRYLAGLFGDDEPTGQNVYWLAKADWLNPPETYGFPYNVGPNTILAAADAELPTQLALIADFMDLGGGGDDVVRMAELLGLRGTAGRVCRPSERGDRPLPKEEARYKPVLQRVGAQVYETLTTSRDFFVDYTLGFIMPHEMMHGYCQARGFPESPRWYYEGVAQWAAYRMQRAMRGEREAEMIFAYYQLLWDRVGDRLKVPQFREADRLGHLNLDTPNYAWYHAGLLRMFRELESRKGSDLLPDLVEAISRESRANKEYSHQKMVALFSRVVAQDLGPWFRDTWELSR